MQPTEELALRGIQETPGRKLGSGRSGEREQSLGQGEDTVLVQGCRFLFYRTHIIPEVAWGQKEKKP